MNLSILWVGIKRLVVSIEVKRVTTRHLALGVASEEEQLFLFLVIEKVVPRPSIAMESKKSIKKVKKKV